MDPIIRRNAGREIYMDARRVYLGEPIAVEQDKSDNIDTYGLHCSLIIYSIEGGNVESYFDLVLPVHVFT